MSKDEGPAERLVEAIGEFRVELIEWIDSQLSYLSESEAWTVSGAGAMRLATFSKPNQRRLQFLRPQPRSGPSPKHRSPPRFQNRLCRSIPDTGLTPWRSRLGERLKLSEETRKGTEQTNRDDVAKDHHQSRR